MPDQMAHPNVCGLSLSWGFNVFNKNWKPEKGFHGIFEGQINDLVILTHAQVLKWDKHLVEIGYRKLTDFYNPLHNTVLTMYLFEPFPERSPGNPKYNPKKYPQKVTKDGNYQITRVIDHYKCWDDHRTRAGHDTLTSRLSKGARELRDDMRKKPHEDYEE